MRKTIDFKGAKIHYNIQGEGTSIFLIHGFLESIQMYKDIAPILQENHQVIQLDLPGHGESEDATESYNMLDLGKLIHKIIDHEQITSCKIVGHSLGGYVGLSFMEQYPEQLDGICIFHSTANADTLDKKNNRNKAIKIVEKDKGSFLSVFIPNLFKPENISLYQEEINDLNKISSKVSDQSLIQTIKAMRDRKDNRSNLKVYKGKKLFIIGKEDPVIPSTELVAQAQETNSVYHVMENVGHMGFIEDRETCIDLIKDFAK